MTGVSVACNAQDINTAVIPDRVGATRRDAEQPDARLWLGA